VSEPKREAARRTMGVWDALGHALGYWRPHVRRGLLLLAALAVPQAYKAFFAYSQRLIIDRGLLGHDGTLLTHVLALLAGGFLAAAAAVLLADYLGASIAAAILNGIRLRMFEHLQKLSIGYYAQARSGDIVARFTSDLTDIQKSLTTRIVDAVVAMLGLAINIPVAFAIDWRLGLVMALGIPVAGLGTRIFGRRAAGSRYALKQQEAALASLVQESVRAQPVVKVFGLVGWLQGRFRAQLEDLRRRFVRAEFAAELVGSASSQGVLVMQVLVLGAGSYLAITGHLTTGSLVAFISLHAVVSKDAYDLTKKVVPSLIASTGGLQRIEELLGEAAQVADRPQANALGRVKGPLRLEDVTFAYGDGHPVLERVSLEIGAGERVALVGRSGSGKSTVLQLLLRFYDPQAGRVTADGQDLRDVRLDSWHDQLAAVFQESFLFAGSVRENIALGRLGAGPEEIEAAARAAEIHDAILALPEGYDTQVGELGGRLSGGQRQRVAIARAMLRDPALLVLDEATSALDPATEAAINATLDRLAVGRMVVLVTHRLATARSADRIVVLEAGRVAEQGSHEQLLARRGLYAELLEKQSGIEVSADGRQARLDPARLAAVPIFAELPAAAREAIASRLGVELYDAGQTVFYEGDPGDRFFVIARGKVAVVAGSGPGERCLAVLADGDFFGELALLPGAPRAASTRTLQPTVLLALPKRDFERLLEEHPEVRAAVAHAAAQRSPTVSGAIPV
jgi:ATP-binding cassette, subfamily B, bacterial